MTKSYFFLKGKKKRISIFPNFLFKSSNTKSLLHSPLKYVKIPSPQHLSISREKKKRDFSLGFLKMETLSSSTVCSPIKNPSLRRQSAKTHRHFETLRFSNSSSGGLRIVARGVSNGGGDGAFGNGFGLVSDEGLPWFESNTDSAHESKIIGTSGMVTQGSRSGLLRTPMSGGVQSATSVHDLPQPALAVRNLMEQARFGHLCTLMSRMHHHREGYPFGSLVDFAPDPIGHPIFSLSPLAIHTRNLLANPKCTLVVQIPGWSALSNARVTIFGDIFPLPADQQEWARKQYLAKHQQWASQQWGNFYYYRMQNISDIYFIGGFGTVTWIDVKEYENLQPDKIAVDGGEQNLKELNALFSKSLREILSAEEEIDDAAFISIDSKGTDIRVRQGVQFNIQRLSFDVDHKVETLNEAKKALQKIISKGLRS